MIQTQINRFDAVLENHDWSQILNTKVVNEKVEIFLQGTKEVKNEYFSEKKKQNYTIMRNYLLHER